MERGCTCKNDDRWLLTKVDLETDRITLLVMVSLMEVALKYPDLPKSVVRIGREFGGLIITELLRCDLMASDDVVKQWKETFYVKEV